MMVPLPPTLSNKALAVATAILVDGGVMKRTHLSASAGVYQAGAVYELAYRIPAAWQAFVTAAA